MTISKIQCPETNSKKFVVAFHHIIPSEITNKKSSKDPLWHSQSLLEHFQKNCMGIAVPIGTAALDEAGFLTKACTLAKSYLPRSLTNMLSGSMLLLEMTVHI